MRNRPLVPIVVLRTFKSVKELARELRVIKLLLLEPQRACKFHSPVSLVDDVVHRGVDDRKLRFLLLLVLGYLLLHRLR